MVLTTRRALVAISAALAVIAITATAARADDSASRSLSILPWSGVYLQIEEREQRLVTAYSHNFDHVRARLELSAPLNSETRQASLFASGRLAGPLSASFFIGYDSAPTFDELAVQYFQNSGECAGLAADAGLANTTSDAFVAAMGNQAARAETVALRRAVLGDAAHELSAKWNACENDAYPQACRAPNPAAVCEGVTEAGTPERAACLAAGGGQYQQALNHLLELLAGHLTAPDDVRRARQIEFVCQRFVDPTGGAVAHGPPVEACVEAAFTVRSQYERLLVHVAQILDRLERARERLPLCLPTEARVWLRAHHDIAGASVSGGPEAEYAAQTIAGLEVGFSYARVTAFPGANIGAGSTGYDQYQLTFGLGMTQYLYGRDIAGYWNVRAGGQVGQRPDVYEVERCRMAPSEEPAVSGETCEDVQVLRSAPSIEASAYLSVAGGVILPTLLDGSRPGLELRLKLDELGQTEVTRWGALLYISPRIDTGPGEAQSSLDPLITRYGVGFEVTQALEGQPAMDDTEAVTVGDAVDFTVFALAGMSL